MSTTRELLMGYGEEKKCIKPKAGFVDQDFGKSCTARHIVVELEHSKTHHTKKDENYMTHFEKFVTEGNEKADELAKAGAMLDEGFMAEVRANTVQQERGSLRGLAVRSELSLLSGRMEGL